MRGKGATVQQRALIEECLKAGVPFFWRGPGTLLISKSDVPDVLRAIVAAGETILGFEGFELDGSEIHPRLDLIAEIEAGAAMSQVLQPIFAWPEGVWVDVTLKVRS